MTPGGTNLLRVRDYNQGVVLDVIRQTRGVSRVEIAEYTGLTAQTVSNIVKRLLEQGIVLEDGRSVSSGGKPRTKLRVNPAAAYAIGVHIDRDVTSYCALDLGGDIVGNTYHPTEAHRGPHAIIDQIAETVHQLIATTGIDQARVSGVGVVFPSVVSYPQGVIHTPSDLPGWDNIPLRHLIEERTGYLAVADNDATAAAIGERWIGGAQGARNFASIYLSVGVGAGLFIENQLYRGSRATAGEFGHMTLDPDGPACFCGSNGCLELYCTPGAMLDHARHLLAAGHGSVLADGSLTYAQLCRAANDGDELALAVVRRSARLLGSGLVSLINLLDLDTVVLCGPALPPVATIYQQEIEYLLGTRIMARNLRHVQLELSRAGANAAEIGAASLVLYETYNPRLAHLNRADEHANDDAVPTDGAP